MPVTVLGPSGVSKPPYGSFSGKAVVIPEGPKLVIPQVPLQHADEVAHRRQIATVLNQLVGRVGTRAGFNKGDDIVSANPLVIGTDGIYFTITGTTGASSMTVDAGRIFFLQFEGVLILTHSSVLDLPGAANITTAAGDHATCFATSSNIVRVMTYQRKAVAP